MIPSIFELALRSLLVASAVAAGLRLLRVRNVLAQKAAWGLVLAASLLMPLLMPMAARWQIVPAAATVVLPAHPWRAAFDPQPAPKAAAPLTATSTAHEFSAPIQFVTPSESDSFSSSNTPAPAAEYSTSSALRSIIQTPPPISRNIENTAPSALPPPSTLAWMVYWSVCAALLLRLFYGLVSAIGLWRDAEPIALESHCTANLRIRASRAVSSPVTIGSGIVLPMDYDVWDAEKLRIVLAHERSHIRQADFYLQLLAGLYASIFWFSPLGWWLKRKLSDLAEAISDRAGLEQAASRSSYAQILLEFAALPRPTLIGVAMARSSSLSHRIERLLNDSSFRQAFAGSRRALLAVLIVPVALFAATALIRVQAAEAAKPAQSQATPPPEAQAPATGQSNPDPASGATAPAPQAPAIAPPPPAQVDPDDAPMPAPPEPPDEDDDSAVTVTKGRTRTYTHTRTNTFVKSDDIASGQSTSSGKGYAYSYSSDGDSWAMITGPHDQVRFSGDWHNGVREELDKAGKLAHGKFLWFTHEGKSYFIDDQAMVSQIDAMYKPMEALGTQQEALGRQQEELGRQQEKLGEQQEQASVPTPDISKEMAELNAAVAKLQAKKGSTVPQEEIADIEGKMGDIQGKLGEIEGRIGEKQGALGAEQGRLGAQQGKLGAEQGRLGAEQGRIAAEADRKVKSIIKESLRDGKAKPVE
jgi:beta-lactamase regulating signal transducer with metallopeptidase domain